MQFLSHFEHHKYSGFEPSQVFDVVYGAHFEHRLLSPRRAVMDHQRLVLGDVRIETGAYDFPVIAQGAMPGDCICIGMVAEGLELTRYNTGRIGDDEIQVYAPNAELMYHATGASRWITFTAPAALLQSLAQERVGQPLELPRRGIVSARLGTGTRTHLRQLSDDAFALARALHPGGLGPHLASGICRAVVTAYVDALMAAQAACKGSPGGASARHYQLVLACERVVVSDPMTEVEVGEIARRSGYSKSSLELIFRRSVGMTPGRYFMNIRLNGALRDLVTCRPGCSVTDVATRWGFRHLSRFAQHYRRAFGELPGETLGRALARMDGTRPRHGAEHLAAADRSHLLRAAPAG